MYHDKLVMGYNNYHITDISPHIEWGEQNDANEFFVALIQTFVSDTRYDEFNKVLFKFLSTIIFDDP